MSKRKLRAENDLEQEIAKTIHQRRNQTKMKERKVENNEVDHDSDREQIILREIRKNEQAKRRKVASAAAK